MKRFDHDYDLLNIGAGGDNVGAMLARRSNAGWELVDTDILPASSDGPADEDGEPLLLFRHFFAWKRPVETLVVSPAWTPEAVAALLKAIKEESDADDEPS